MSSPNDLRYTREHEWVRVEGDKATVGITDFAQDQLGDLVYFDLSPVGTQLRQGDKLGEVESVKAVSEVYSPVSGEITAINEVATESPEKVNEDPYGAGWLVQMRASDVKELDNLLSPEQYDELIAAE